MAQKYRSSRGGSQRSGSSRSGSSRPSSSRSGGASRGGGSSRGGGRGRGGYSAPKKSNTGPTIAAVVIVVLVIVGLVVAFGGGGDKKPTKPDTSYRNPSLKPTRFTPMEEDTEPAGPVRLPPPEVAAEAKDMAKRLAAEAKDLAAQGEVLYQESVAAKKAGNDELWQEKLKEAAAYYHEIMDAYNDLVGRMPTNDDWNEEQVANHYLGREAGQINKYISRLSQIRKQRRR